MQLMLSATLTSQGVLSGFLFLLVHFKDVQSKIRDEINYIIGKERQPCNTDRQKMPYTYACILEALRYQSHLAITATHTASADVTFDGFLIPEGASVSSICCCKDLHLRIDNQNKVSPSDEKQ